MAIIKRAPLNSETIKTFSKGTRVRATGGVMCGMLGTVYRPVKSRGVITVEFDGHACLFDAHPERLEVLKIVTV